MRQKGNMMAEKGILVVVSGFSGAGKGTLMKRLMEKYDNYALSISVTTRKPRPGEEDGREYFFRTKEEVEEERRMFYVAMTRARKKLIISYTKERNGKSMAQSRFVGELLTRG